LLRVFTPLSGANNIPINAPAATPANTPSNTFPEFIINYVFNNCFIDGCVEEFLLPY
jgi:hypothetical protein